jgi:flagellar hook-length control protein FliK
VSVNFTSPHASVRDAVEQSLPRLREMMEEQGLQLGDSSVNDQGSESDQESRDEGRRSQFAGDMESGAEAVASQQNNGDGLSLVDYYA